MGQRGEGSDAAQRGREQKSSRHGGQEQVEGSAAPPATRLVLLGDADVWAPNSMQTPATGQQRRKHPELQAAPDDDRPGPWSKRARETLTSTPATQRRLGQKSQWQDEQEQVEGSETASEEEDEEETDDDEDWPLEDHGATSDGSSELGAPAIGTALPPQSAPKFGALALKAAEVSALQRPSLATVSVVHPVRLCAVHMLVQRVPRHALN